MAVDPRAARRNVDQAGLVLAELLQRARNQLRSVVYPQYLRRSAGQCERRFELGDEAFGGDRRSTMFISDSRVFVDHRGDLDSASVSIGATEDTQGRFRANRVLTCRPSRARNTPELTSPIRRIVNYRLIAAAHPQVLIIAWNRQY
jgi:hypothetical protein